METTQTAKARTSEVTIFERLLNNGKEDMTPELAGYLLSLGFGEEDKARMHELAVKNQEDALSPEEQEELRAYAKAGCLLGILHSRARKSLKKAGKNKAS